MNKLFVAVIMAVVFSAAAYADYGSDMRDANKAYKAKDYMAALELYRNAYAQNPNEKLGAFINRLEQSLGLAGPIEAKEPDSPQNALSVSVAPFIFGEVSGEYARAFGGSYSMALGGIYSWTRSIAGGYAAFYWYPEKKALRSWYFGGGVFYSNCFDPPEWTSLPFHFSCVLSLRAGYRLIFGPLSLDFVASYPVAYVWTSTSMVYSLYYGGAYLGFAF